MKRQGDTARLYHVRGSVQGVGFRYYVHRAAVELGLTGYVKNLDDGRVEVFASGPPDQLAELRQRLWAGPSFAEVRGVEEQEVPVRPSSSFQIEPFW